MNSNNKSCIQKNLLRWFKKNGRDLPWRKTRDPYRIWVSEIMLQQTQVKTVIPYYQKFLKTFPTVRHLAKADLSKVLALWEGLGYYSRARNLHKASREVLNRFKGKIPDHLNDLLRLPGIGRYTAGAILSIAFNQEAPILDGNAKRVLSRLYAISNDPGRNETEALLWRLSESLVPENHASFFNQALMDLGATICSPKAPRCVFCPLIHLCEAKARGDSERYPTRVVKKRIPRFHAVGAVIQKDGKVLLNHRPPNGLLGGLWEFPNWPREGKKDLERHLTKKAKREMGITVKSKGPIGLFQQTFSHFKLSLHAYRFQAYGKKENGKWIPVQKLHLFPMSRIHRRIANSLQDRSS
ncbi:MAG TPA: A/G-specific adenine glycosylase [Thermodesulfobacteriota bacterium]|nr:A/G-specific adenine glycosylase [Thermodesulfobacteriota bacterium]